MKKEQDINGILEALIKDALKEVQPSLAFEKIEIEPPKDSRFGDLSTNLALKISRFSKQNPAQAAEDLIGALKEKLRQSPAGRDIAEIKNQNGFINFFFKREYYYKQLKEILLLKNKFGKINIGNKNKVLIEFVSANPTGPLSLAHARQAVIGDCLANILSFLGFKVKREYYLNDEGNQIQILGESISLRLKELAGEKIEFPENYYQGEYISDIAREIREKKFPPQGLAGSPRILAEKIDQLAEYAVDYILTRIKKDLDDFGVHFDYWSSQKELRKKGRIEKTLKFLKGKRLIYEQDGALWFRSTQFNDDKDRVVLKKDGSYTYLAPDIAYHKDKYRRGFNWLINFWGPDHHGYLKRLKAAVEALGYKRESLSIIIVQLASIFKDGSPLQMSTRRGQYISLREIIDQVGCDTSRFFFLMRRTSSHLDFDLGVAKKHTPENPVYYIQYAHARICSIVSKSKLDFKIKNVKLSLLTEKEELVLLRTLAEFPAYLGIVLRTLDPYIISVYLQGLANDFHKFYDLHRVLVDDPDLKNARLLLIEGTRIILGLGLSLLGISRPEKM